MLLMRCIYGAFYGALSLVPEIPGTNLIRRNWCYCAVVPAPIFYMTLIVLCVSTSQ